jgi:hypothetical protein
MIAATAIPAMPEAAVSPTRLDPLRPTDLALIFRKLAYATDDRIGFWWLKGTRCALIDTDLIPLWDMHIGEVFRTDDLSDGRFEVASLQTSFYSDIRTGERLRTFTNPLTQETVEIGYGAPRVAHLVFDGVGRTDAPTGPLANLAREARIGPAWIEGDDVWVEGDIQLRGDAPPGVRPIRVNDLTTYFGSAKDILDPDIAMPLAGQMFSDINIWPPWLKMGDLKGDYYSRCYGRKVATFDAMPGFWRQSMLRSFPDITTDFARALSRR